MPTWQLRNQPTIRQKEESGFVGNYYKYIGYDKYMDPDGKPSGAKDFGKKLQWINSTSIGRCTHMGMVYGRDHLENSKSMDLVARADV